MVDSTAISVMRRSTRLAMILVMIVTLLGLGLLAGCGTSTSDGSESNTSDNTDSTSVDTGESVESVELNVSVVVALEKVMEATKAGFEEANNCTIVYNYANAAVLQTQAQGGSETDVIMVTPKELKVLSEDGLILDDTTMTFAKNSLVIMVAEGNPLGIDDPSDLDGLGMLTTGDPEITAQGPKAKEWLTNIGMWDSLESKFVYAKDAAQITEYVSSGEIDAAICFSSNVAMKPGVEIAYSVPSGEYTVPQHAASILATSENMDLAEKYMEYLQSDEFQAALTEAGFLLP